MRRLLALLLLIVGFGTLAPCAPPVAAAAPHHAGMAMPGGCHDDGGITAHECIGCAIAPEAAAPVLAAPVRVVTRYPVRVAAASVTHRTGFDPPPPRAAA